MFPNKQKEEEKINKNTVGSSKNLGTFSSMLKKKPDLNNPNPTSVPSGNIPYVSQRSGAPISLNQSNNQFLGNNLTSISSDSFNPHGANFPPSGAGPSAAPKKTFSMNMHGSSNKLNIPKNPTAVAGSSDIRMKSGFGTVTNPSNLLNPQQPQNLMTGYNKIPPQNYINNYNKARKDISTSSSTNLTRNKLISTAASTSTNMPSQIQPRLTSNQAYIPTTFSQQQQKVPSNKNNNESDYSKNNANNNNTSNDEANSSEQIQHCYTTTNGEKRTILYTSKVVGQGSFGVVFFSKLIETGEIVAIKRVFQDARYKNRELQLMQKLARHPNVVEMKHFFFSKTQKFPEEVYLNLVLEYVPITIHKFIGFFSKNSEFMPIIYVKVFMFQLLKALNYLHTSFNMCHRDIKTQNLLIDPVTGVLKLCDFGSAKQLIEGEVNVSYICSRYYRAPELIFGAQMYNCGIDTWSAGCVLGECLLGRPLFPGESSVEQIVEIMRVLGTPSNEDVVAMNKNYTEFKFPAIQKQEWKSFFDSKRSKFMKKTGKNVVFQDKMTSADQSLVITTLSAPNAASFFLPSSLQTASGSQSSPVPDFQDFANAARKTSSYANTNANTKFLEIVPNDCAKLISALLQYDPSKRVSPLEALAHPFFDELRDPAAKLPNGRELPSHLFQFSELELSRCTNPAVLSILVPKGASNSAMNPNTNPK